MLCSVGVLSMYQCEFMKLPIERPRIPDAFVINSSEMAVFYIGGNNKVVVPTAYNGKKISTMGSALFLDNKDLKELVVSEGITHIY